MKNTVLLFLRLALLSNIAIAQSPTNIKQVLNLTRKQRKTQNLF